jgi:hypothetical protein
MATLHASSLDYCHRCTCDTPTKYLLLSSGLVANVCAVCRTCRRGRPYVPRHFLTDTAHNAPVGADGDFRGNRNLR